MNSRAYRGVIWGSAMCFVAGRAPAVVGKMPPIPLLQEVMVTAEKMPTPLERTPVAVTAFTADRLARDNIQSLQGVALRAPSVSYVEINKGEVYISIRGSRVNTPGAGWNNQVTTFVDGVPMTGMGDNAPDLYDLRSIQVLRGPQGTLFGANVIGGAIVIRTAPPSFRTHGKAEISYGQNNLVQTRAMVTGPLLGHTLSAKVTVNYKYRDNYLRNVTLHDETYGDNIGAVRGQLLWKPVDDLRVLFITGFTHDQSSGKISQLLGKLEPTLFPGLSYGAEVTNQGRNSTMRKNVLGSSMRVEWSRPWGSVTSITGLRDVRVLTNLSRLGDPANQAWSTTRIRDKQWTEELRLASRGGGRLTWLGGLFYMHASKMEDDLYTYNLNPNTVNGGAFPVPIAGVSQNVYQHVIDEVGAAFGQAGYELMPKWKLTLGARVQWERKYGVSSDQPSFSAGVPYDVVYPLIFSAATARYSHTWHAFTPKMLLSYQATPALMLYASATEGYQSGGWDTSAASDYGLPGAEISRLLARAFQPETVWSYEGGAKFLSDDRRYRANLAAFVENYRNMQTNVFDPVTAAFITTNAGRAQAKGVEIETREELLPWLSMGLDYTYLLARYTQYIESPTQNNSGNVIPVSPKNAVHLSVDARFPLGGADGTLSVGGDVTYRSRVYFSDTNSEANFLLNDSRYNGIVNSHVTWYSDSGNWHVSLFARNLTNRHTVAYATDVSGFFLTPVEASDPANRIYAVERIPTRLFELTVAHNW